MPYGPKSPETVRRYAREAARFFARRGVKALVIACNTATAHACSDLAARSASPVIGVVDPGAQAAAAASGSGRIGVIGTRGTIESGTYERAILRLRPDAKVISGPCPLFVALAEEGWIDGPVAELTARRYLEPMLAERIDTLLLGCTHYPLLAPLIAEVAGPAVTLVDSAAATAKETALRIAEGGLETPRGAVGDREYFVTDDERRFSEIADRFLGAPATRVERAVLEEDPEPGDANAPPQ